VTDQHRTHSRAWRDYAQLLVTWTEQNRTALRPDGSQEYPEDARGAFQILRAARIFAFERPEMELLEQVVSGYLSQHMPEEWHAAASGTRDLPPDRSSAMVDRMLALVHGLGAPRLPFPCVLLWHAEAGARPVDDGLLYALYARELLGALWQRDYDVQRIRQVGLLVSGPDFAPAPARCYIVLEMIFAARSGPNRGRRTTAYSALSVGWDGRPERVWTLAYFLLHASCAAIEQCSTATVQIGASTLSLCSEVRDARKLGLGAHVPRSYHAVTITPSLVWGAEQKPEPTTEQPPGSHLTHRHDVRGHWRVLVRMGEAPGACPPASRTALERRGYKVFDDGADVPKEDAQRMTSRAVLLRPGYWYAYLRVWVRDHVRGPEDGPFVPTVRRVRPEM
jgi:hypothetical protein